jgi:hypothetical protein
MKVRADASPRSFRKARGLQACREQARLHLQAVMAHMDRESALQVRKTQEQHARRMNARIEQALAVVQQLEQRREQARPSEREQMTQRASSTDPEARIMRMHDGGWGPGYNVQFCTVGSGQGGALAVVGVQVSQQGNDRGSVLPMRERVGAWLGAMPAEVLVDSDHVDLDLLRQADAQGLSIVSPVPAKWAPNSRYQNDTTRAWMQRMERPVMKARYRERKAIAERPHAFFKRLFGLRQVPVRGQDKVEGLFLLAALVFTIHEHRSHWMN